MWRRVVGAFDNFASCVEEDEDVVAACMVESVAQELMIQEAVDCEDS